jgi:hypothetical protein
MMSLDTEIVMTNFRQPLINGSVKNDLLDSIGWRESTLLSRSDVMSLLTATSQLFWSTESLVQGETPPR